MSNGATAATVKKLCDGLGISLEEFFHSELFQNLEQKMVLWFMLRNAGPLFLFLCLYAILDQKAMVGPG